ncbi:MAG: hypothetical protein IKS43_03850 [Clostridia bacterium]|nr:hypothetical protein [Clostridia bacterium]
MKLKDWLKERKRRREAARLNKLRKSNVQEPVPLTPLEPLEPDTEGITPPESRFTDEYRDFLKEQESASQGNMISREEK